MIAKFILYVFLFYRNNNGEIFMQVSKIQNNQQNYSQINFKSGISSNLYKKLVLENLSPAAIVKKAGKISKVNKDEFVLSDAFYNANDKVASFNLSLENSAFVPNTENLKSQVLTVSGDSLSDAFLNINLKDLKNANDLLLDDVEKIVKDEKQAKLDFAKKQKNVESDLHKKFDSSKSFWIDYYKKLDAAKYGK